MSNHSTWKHPPAEQHRKRRFSRVVMLLVITLLASLTLALSATSSTSVAHWLQVQSIHPDCGGNPKC